MAKFMELMGLYFMENLVEPQDRSLKDFHQTLAVDKGYDTRGFVADRITNLFRILEVIT